MGLEFFVVDVALSVSGEKALLAKDLTAEVFERAYLKWHHLRRRAAWYYQKTEG